MFCIVQLDFIWATKKLTGSEQTSRVRPILT